MLERRRTPAVLFEGCTAEGVEENFQGGVGADLVQCLALVLEDLLPRHGLGAQHAALGGAVHVFHQVALQGARQQRRLLLDEGVCGGVGQVLDGLAAQDRQFAPPGVQRTQLAVGFRQVIANQVEQQGLDLAVVEQLHFQAVFQVDQAVADIVCRLHEVDQRVAGPALCFELWQGKLVGDLFEQGELATCN